MTSFDPNARTAGPGPRVVVESAPDTASINGGNHLRQLVGWTGSGHELEGYEILQATDGSGPAGHPIFLARIAEWHIRREGIGEEIRDAIGAPIEALLVLSRHRAASGHPSFTAHPVGNPGDEAVAGGAAGEPTPTHPGLLTTALHELGRAKEPTSLPHSVGFEATHHGPLTGVPVVFIEIGSDERHWEDPIAGGVLAQAAWSAVTKAPTNPPVSVMGLGGGHYVPRFSALVSETPATMGHMLAAYHWDKEGNGPDTERIAAFLRASAPPGKMLPDGVYFDKKSLPGTPRAKVRGALEALSVPILRSSDIVERAQDAPHTDP